MKLDDLTCIDINEEMVIEARRIARLRAINEGGKTRAAFGDRELGDTIGDLAEQVVAIKLQSAGLAFKAYRESGEKAFGDPCDIEYDGDKIDVKGTRRGGLHDEYFYSKEFLVFADQVKDIEKKNISHYCFVYVSPELDHACIYGVISTTKFSQVCYPVKLKYDNYGIKAWELLKYGQRFVDYIYRNR